MSFEIQTQNMVEHISYFSIIYHELDYQFEKLKFSNYDAMCMEYESTLRETLNDQTLRLLIMEPSSMKLHLSTIQLLPVLSELGQTQFKLPAPKIDKFNRVQVCVSYHSSEIKFVYADLLSRFVNILLEDSKYQSSILTNIEDPGISTPHHIDPIEVTEDVLRPICEKVISYAQTTRPYTLHFIQLEDELVGEVRWDKTVDHNDWLHIIVYIDSICIVYDKPGKDEYIELNDPHFQRRVAAALTVLSL